MTQDTNETATEDEMPRVTPPPPPTEPEVPAVPEVSADAEMLALIEMQKALYEPFDFSGVPAWRCKAIKRFDRPNGEGTFDRVCLDTVTDSWGDFQAHMWDAHKIVLQDPA